MPSGRRVVRTGRLEAFSDGVFAIAITLLVLDLAVPTVGTDDLLGTLVEQWPNYVGYIVSFATVGALWVAHTVFTDHLEHADALLLRLNLLVLLVVGFLPFPTRLLGEFFGEDRQERVAVTAYGLVLVAAWLALAVTWRHARRAGLFGTDGGDVALLQQADRMTPGLIGYGVFLVVGLFAPRAAVFGYLALAVFYLLPVLPRRFRRA